MPVPSSITELSQTASSNYPTGAESPITADNYWRAHAAFIAQLRDGAGFANPATLASATTTSIGAQASMFVEITGTTTITSFGATYNGPRFLRFTGALTLTHNATTLNLPGASNITTAAGDTCIAIPNSTGNGWNVVNYQSASTTPISLMSHGRCRLSYQSSTALILTPYNGNTIVINGQVVTIPSAGVTLSNSGISGGTLYYIYAYLNSGVLTLEYSTTGHSTDTTTGVEIKTGDATRTLVGMAYGFTGSVWAGGPYTLSYFNRREITAVAMFSADRSTGSTIFGEINSEIGITWLTWADEKVKFSVIGGCQNSATAQTRTSIGVDGVVENVRTAMSGTNVSNLSLLHSNNFSEGVHYSSIFGRVGSASTGTWQGTSGVETTQQVTVMG